MPVAETSARLSSDELRAGAGLAGVFALRMLGLFLILPVFAVHAPTLEGGDNLTLVGLALGAYGLAQALLQLPYGIASDRWGRKPLIYGGLIVFAAGSFLAASASTIWVAIAGRLLQGAGAISSVVIALAADLTREQHRTKVMAMIGASIGLSFALSLVLAPALYQVVGMTGIFVLTGLLALAAALVVRNAVPDVPGTVRTGTQPRGRLRRDEVLGPELLRLNVGIFVLHLVQMAMFVVMPPLLVSAGLPLVEHWKLYLPVVLASFVLMAPAVFVADRRGASRPVLLGAVCLLIVVEALLGAGARTLAAIAALLVAFFAAFNVLEAMIPSLVTRFAPAHARGAAIGVFNTTQTLGLFVGGVLGGWIAQHAGAAAVFAVCAALAVLWLVIASGMQGGRPPAVNETLRLTFSLVPGVDIEALRDALAEVHGVRDVDVDATARIARLTVVAGGWDERTVRSLLGGSGGGRNDGGSRTIRNSQQGG